jgi:hypothetical protein
VRARAPEVPVQVVRHGPLAPARAPDGPVQGLRPGVRTGYGYGWIPHNASFGFLDRPPAKLGQIHF